MKKLISVALSILLLMACFTTAMAEGTIDFSGYSLEELLEIRSDLADEIASRPGGEKMTLGSGQYKIGEDLPAGVYTFKFVQNGDSDVSRTDYYIYENESMYKYDVDRLWLGDMPRVEGSFKGDGETRISLYPGEYLSPAARCSHCGPWGSSASGISAKYSAKQITGPAWSTTGPVR